MELDELKNIWRKNSPAFHPKGEAELSSMLKADSKSVISRLKKSAWLELIFAIAIGIGLLVYALQLPNGSLKWTPISIIVLVVVYSLYYIKKLMLLNSFQGDVNVKVNLEKLIENLTSYLKFYQRSYTILYPLYFCLGLIFRAIDLGPAQFMDSITKPQVVITLLVFAVLFYATSVWVTKWYLKKLYGNHLDKLKAILTELNDQNI